MPGQSEGPRKAYFCKFCSLKFVIYGHRPPRRKGVACPYCYDTESIVRYVKELHKSTRKRGRPEAWMLWTDEEIARLEYWVSQGVKTATELTGKIGGKRSYWAVRKFILRKYGGMEQLIRSVESWKNKSKTTRS